jgi:uncharacterized membrane protein HdeD (DUF308 family)
MFSKSDIEKYFMAEKQESLLFIVIGVIAIAAAIAFFFFIRSSFFKGAALPLLIIGVIQLVVGYTVYSRSDDDRVRNVYAYDMDPSSLKQNEIPRMEAVNKNFVIYRWIEIALLTVGVVLILVHSRNPGGVSYWYGLGIGLALQAFIMLGADYFAERRALKYYKGLVEFTNAKH